MDYRQPCLCGSAEELHFWAGGVEAERDAACAQCNSD